MFTFSFILNQIIPMTSCISHSTLEDASFVKAYCALCGALMHKVKTKE